jgi:general secretion pathway protein A
MYCSFYHFKEKPFNLLPDPDYLYLSSKHQSALNHLDYGLTDQTGFIIVIGDMGTGKTTLLKHMVRNLDESVKVAIVFNTNVSSLELMQMILREYDCGGSQYNKSKCYDELYDFFLDQYALRNRCILIIDEAQNLSPTSMEEIRMLSNINVGKDNLVQIILAGQFPLKLKLEHKSMRQLAQRITMDFVLEPLGQDETREYILHRMKVAGRDNGDTLFAHETFEKIYQSSGGIPRLINILCDGALIYGFADKLTTIHANVIDEVLSEKKIKSQFYDNSHTREGDIKEQVPSTLIRNIRHVSRRLEIMEKQFADFQNQHYDHTIQKLEKLLEEERAKLRRAIYVSGQKDVSIKVLKQRVAALAERIKKQR